MTLTFFNYRIKSKCDDFMLKILIFSNSIFYILSYFQILLKEILKS